MAIPAGPVAPAGTFLPGTKVQCGNHRVVIDKYLSEGGFAHVYVVTLPRPVDGKEKAVLKRVAVPDKEQLAEMRNEVETMKRLRGNKQIVKYIDSHASSLKNGGFEVFLLMEWCNGGGLIDFMNTRLQNRLTEPEILTIFTDIAEGVACMHYLKPALMHRDLKVENVLISTEGKSRTFKLCDFGSAAPARPAATSAAEGRLIEDDVQRHTTLQYRSPEMIDVYRKQPINEKSDIWALGCFLYKLCYYTTPFEEVGQMAILNASFKYPGYPRFSDDLKLLIASMLREQPSQRPNIYQVLAKACKLDGRSLSVKDIYTGRSQSEEPKVKVAPKPTSQAPTGATVVPPKQEAALSIPQVEPMRRGRPLKPMSHHNSAKPSPSPLRMMDHKDAFSGLDPGAGGSDELSSKFPRLDEFSLLTDKGKNFAFSSSQTKPSDNPQPDLAQRVTQALADEAFARPVSPTKPKPPIPVKADDSRGSTDLQRKRSTETSDSRLSQRSQMVSTGTMTSLSPPPPSKLPPISSKPIWRVPEKDTMNRSASITQASSRTKPIISKDRGNSRLANLLSDDASRSQPGNEDELRSPTSSRPSLEGGRPLMRDLDSGVQRSRSLNSRNRPVSVNMGTRPTHINDKEIRHVPSGLRPKDHEHDPQQPPQATPDLSHRSILSDMEYLRVREEEDREKHKHLRRHSSNSKHHKRTSLPSAAMSGTKNLIHGRFGEAFRKFEGHADENAIAGDSYSSGKDEQNLLSPIEGSVATDLSDDRRGMDETEELPPELRRELEKQKQEAEERRVERAAAEYRQKVDVRGSGPPPVSVKATSIQNRVQSLLQDNDKPAQKTATGYGRFTSDATANTPSQANVSSSSYPHPQHDPRTMSAPASAIDLPSQTRMNRPTAPPKPQTLRTGTNTMPVQQTNVIEDDWEDDFSRKYPALPQEEITGSGVDNRSNPHQLRMREI